MSRVVILMGSVADDAHARAIADAVSGYGVEVITRVGSAHKTPEHVIALVRGYDQPGTVFVTIAGRSNALSAFVDACVSVPVIACPPLSGTYAAEDLWSSVRLPSGVASMTVLEPANAALAAVKILALGDTALRERIAAHQAAERAKVVDADAALTTSTSERT